MGRTSTGDTGVGFDNTTVDNTLVLDTTDKPIVAWEIRGDNDASYSIDVSDDKNTWYEDVETYSTTSTVSDGANTPERYVRVRVTSAASSGTADVLITAAD